MREAALETLMDVARASTPAGEADWPPLDETETGARLRAQVAALPPAQRRLLGAGLRTLRLYSLMRRGRRFGSLAPDEADALLSDLSASRLPLLRRLAHVLRMLTRFAYFSGEEAHAAMTLDGPWLGRVEVPAEAPPRLVEGGEA